MRINLTTRLCLASAALLGIFGAARAFQDRDMPTELSHPTQQLNEMPSNFESWRGEDAHLDPQVFKAIGADMAINRVYQQGPTSISLHSAVFLKYSVRTPHPPELCYRGNGYAVESTETTNIPGPSGGGRAARLLTLEREGSRLYCLYWYQIGDTTFLEGDGQRRAVQSLRGQKVWPPMIKVMLQTAANSPEEAAASLKKMAGLVYPWTRDFH